MDVRLKNGSIFQIVGPSGSGKTYFVHNLIEHRNEIFRNKVKTIHWFQGAGMTNQRKEKLEPCITLHSNGLRDLNTLKFKPYDMIVLDDLFIEARNDDNVTNLFTKTARHNNVTVVYITQNMFHTGNSNRTRNLNVHYLVLFKNPRDSMAIEQIARQMYGSGGSEGRQFLMQAFRDATQGTPHGYLFFDFTQECPEELRIRTSLFANNGPYVYKQVSHSEDYYY